MRPMLKSDIEPVGAWDMFPNTILTNQADNDTANAVVPSYVLGKFPIGESLNNFFNLRLRQLCLVVIFAYQQKAVFARMFSVALNGSVLKIAAAIVRLFRIFVVNDMRGWPGADEGDSYELMDTEGFGLTAWKSPLVKSDSEIVRVTPRARLQYLRSLRAYTSEVRYLIAKVNGYRLVASVRDVTPLFRGKFFGGKLWLHSVVSFVVDTLCLGLHGAQHREAPSL